MFAVSSKPLLGDIKIEGTVDSTKSMNRWLYVLCLVLASSTVISFIYFNILLTNFVMHISQLEHSLVLGLITDIGALSLLFSVRLLLLFSVALVPANITI